MLKGHQLSIRTRKRAILDQVSFQIPSASIATVLGPSGSGKTTLLRTIMGLERADSGELYFEDTCLSSDTTHVAAESRDMSLVFQEFTLFPNMDVARNLSFGLQRPGNEQELIDDLLQLLEIEHLRHRRIDRLSGGEQQRVALARALAVRPRVLLMDEPFSNIDNMLRERLYSRLHARLREYGMTTLIATHDHKEAFFFSDSILVLKDGKLIDQNSPRHIYQNPANAWVAQFFGETNILSTTQLQQLKANVDAGADNRYLVRPEALTISPTAGESGNARIKQLVYYGAYQDVHLQLLDGTDLRARCLGAMAFNEEESVMVTLHDHVVPHALVDL